MWAAPGSASWVLVFIVDPSPARLIIRLRAAMASGLQAATYGDLRAGV
jgi:hypothetical protein